MTTPTKEKPTEITTSTAGQLNSAQTLSILTASYIVRKLADVCYIADKPKGPVLENTIGSEVAAPTVKRGFVMPKFKRYGVSRAVMVAGKMGLPARMAARLIPCFQHLAHPMRLKTCRVVPQSRSGAETMTKVVTLVRPCASIQSNTDASTTNPEAIRLHGLASNALSMASSLLNRTDTTLEELQKATARAVRAASLLKQACQLANCKGV